MNEIRTERLALRPLRPEHAESLYHIWSDGQVVRYTYMRTVGDVGTCMQNLLTLLDSSARREDAGPCGIFFGTLLIGVVGAVRLSKESCEHELYYHLGRPYWGRGYATEAAGAMIDHLFSLPRVHRVSAEVVTENLASIRVLEKAGMAREGRLRGKFYRDNAHSDLFVYSILRPEWQQRKAMAVAMSSSGISGMPLGGR